MSLTAIKFKECRLDVEHMRSCVKMSIRVSPDKNAILPTRYPVGKK